MAKNTYKQDEILEEPFDIRHLLRASSYIKKYRRGMILAIVLSGIGGAFGYVAPMIIQRALDIAVPDKNMRLLFSLVAALIAIYVVSVIFTTIRSRIMVDVSQNIIYDIRKDLFEHLQELPFQYYDDRPHGKILIRVVNYVNSVSDMLSNGLINIVLEAFNLLFIIIFMFMVDVQMALVVLCGVPVLAVFMFWIKNKQRKAWQAVSNKNSNLNAYLQENIVGARITQIFAREDENAKIFNGLSKECRRTWNTAVRYSNLVWPGIDTISVFVRAAIFLFGLVIFGQGNKSLGTIVAISSYASYFWQPIMNLGNIFNNFINNIAYLERIFETIDEPVTVKDAEHAIKMPKIRGKVTFDHVTFAYDETKTIVCHLGNGSSVTAVLNGKSVDTSMGLTPLEGLVMGTRCGDIDPAIMEFLAHKLDLDVDGVMKILNKDSGVYGLSGGLSSDFRDLTDASLAGDKKAQIAMEVFSYRVAKYIGAYVAVMNGVDDIVFTAGIGENDDIVREQVCSYLGYLGIEFNTELNKGLRGKETELSMPGSKVKVFVIPTNEELAIARETLELVRK